MPGLLSSPVCLTVIWFLSWSLHPSRAQIWSDEVSGLQYGRLESNVTLACGKSQIRIPVVWHLNRSSVLPWHKVTSDGRLVLLHVDPSAQGDYSCYDNSGLLLHSVTLKLGHPPGWLNVSCKVPSHRHVRCSWMESIQTFLPAKYNATFRGKDEEGWPCIVDVSQQHCDVDFPAFWQPSHTLDVTETNALGSQTTPFQVRLHEQLKPDPPESVTVRELEGSPRQLRVSWNHPSSWPEHVAFPLLFQIRYRPQGSMYWSELYSERTDIVIVDALSGHDHQVQVRARDEVNSDTKWSDWTPVILIRPWEADSPSGPTEEPGDGFPDCFTCNTEQTETTTTKSHYPVHEDEGNLSVVIILVLFSVFILTTVLSLIFIVWMRQRRREHATKQELTSMVKMKSVAI
ncbi:interleukin-11 receptor subunit alpha [Cololabis saira]|uniref:interleukin-11 receptor subunit alpha n=1 Tax=Cololabis saira TaxID=129043 RepID=UPI002AD30778|nr:interleukin-11 receptor subunit alpha [Cololabis saira]